MPTYELSLTLRQDGAVVPGFPVLRRVEVDESQSGAFELPPADDTTTWTAGVQLNTLNFLLVATDRPISLRLNDQSEATDRPSIPLKAGGMLVLVDTDIVAGGEGVRANNASGATAFVRLFLGGT